MSKTIRVGSNFLFLRNARETDNLISVTVVGIHEHGFKIGHSFVKHSKRV